MYKNEINSMVKRWAKAEGKKVQVSVGNLREIAAIIVRDDAEQRFQGKKSPLGVLATRANNILSIKRSKASKKK